MALTGSGANRYPSLPGGSGYSVSRTSTVNVSFAGQGDLTHLWLVIGKAASTPALFSDLSSVAVNENPTSALAFSAKFDGLSSYAGSIQEFLAASVPGWTVGSHLWAMLFDQASQPSGADAPAVVIDLGVTVA